MLILWVLYAPSFLSPLLVLWPRKIFTILARIKESQIFLQWGCSSSSGEIESKLNFVLQVKNISQMQVNKNVSGSSWVLFLWYAKQMAAAALPERSRVQTRLPPSPPHFRTVALSAWGKWEEHFSGWDLCSRLCESHSLPPTVNKKKCRLSHFSSLETTHFEKYLCARACLYTWMWCAYARTRAEVSVGSFPTLSRHRVLSLFLFARLACKVPKDLPVSASYLAVECWGYRYGLLFSNQNSDSHTHAGRSSIQTQP